MLEIRPHLAYAFLRAADRPIPSRETRRPTLWRRTAILQCSVRIERDYDFATEKGARFGEQID
ncbi:hypothetical protein BS630_03115 [Rhizobium laguerreae]|nr:hypothetical protein BS630_03115 [Rhizobium laguerreae]